MVEDQSVKIVVGSVIVAAAATTAVILRLSSHRIVRSAYDLSDLLIVIGLASIFRSCAIFRH